MEKSQANKLPLPESLQEIQLTYLNPIKKNDRLKCRCSLDFEPIARHLMPEGLIELQVNVYAVFLNRANHVLGYIHLSTGNNFSSHVDVSQILTTACKTNASSVVILFNHPTGNLRPSRADVRITYDLYSTLRTVQIELLDVIIYGPETYYSASDEMLMSAVEKDFKANKTKLSHAIGFTIQPLD